MDTIRRKEAELSVIQKERDLLRHTQEEDTASLRKRYQSSIDEQNHELDEFRRIKHKYVISLLLPSLFLSLILGASFHHPVRRSRDEPNR